MDPKTRKIVEDLERERDALFRRFLEFSEMAERYNEKAYEITCQIESINLALRKAGDLGIIEPREGDGRALSHVPRHAESPEGEEEGEETECDFGTWWDAGDGGGAPGKRRKVRAAEPETAEGAPEEEEEEEREGDGEEP